MAIDFQSFVDSFNSPACVLSVEKKETGSRRIIRIVTGNRQYLDTIEKSIPGLNSQPKKFIPNTEYHIYVPQDMNFESACIQAAINKKRVTGYVHPEKFDYWFNMLYIPLKHNDDDFCYCLYLIELSHKADAKKMASISSDIASAVLETCINLRSSEEFSETMNLICRDIRELCESEHCCILLMDTARRKCSVLCEAFSAESKLLPMENYINDYFYLIAESWQDTLGGSNCIIVRNEKEMDFIKEQNPAWHESITQAGGKNVILFPMKFKGELLGYIWALNFSAEKSDTIKETLELTTFILASELYSYKMMERLHILSSRDMLTGVMNRNEMNNYVTDLVQGTHKESVGIIFADLNGLKAINDSEGHVAGDKLLKDAANALKEVFPRKSIFRAGGDEFVVILTRITEEELSDMADSLREVSVKYDRLVFAVGTAYEDDTANIQKALHNADERMYADKKRYYELHPEKKRSTARS